MGRLLPQRLQATAITGLALLIQPAIAPQLATAESICYGTTSQGALEGGCQLPAQGPNFGAYARLGIWLGRTWVHCTVADVVEASYGSLARTHSDKVFVYAETGFRSGGRFKPHKTHQNGLSVDFMVPVLDERGVSVRLPTGPASRFGYGLEFDAGGRLEDDLQIDFDAIAAHLAALKKAAANSNISIWRVIFDPQLQQRLRESPGWAAIKDLEFSKRRSWVRHDQHYHVDFQVPCQPLDANG